MRVFLAFLQSKIPVSYHGFWPRYMKAGLEEAGHEWIEDRRADWGVGLAEAGKGHGSAWRASTWPGVLEAVRTAHRQRPIDVFLSYFFPELVDVSTIDEIKTMGIPCVNFYCDNVREYRSVPAEFRPFNLHWVPELEALTMYRRAGLQVLHAPMPCWIDPSLRVPPTTETHGVTFVGSRDSLRLRLLAEAAQHGAPIEVYGRAWDEGEVAGYGGVSARWPTRVARQARFVRQQGVAALARKLLWRALPQDPPELPGSMLAGPVSFDEYPKLLRESAVTIGINRYESYRHPRSRPGVYSRLRDIEAPMLGACLLTEWTPDIEELYEIGKEVEVYRDAAELAGKAAALLADPGKRQAMRAAAQRRALTDHSIPATIERISQRLASA